MPKTFSKLIRQLPAELLTAAQEIQTTDGFSSVEAVFREALRQSPIFAAYDIEWPEVTKGGARPNSGPKPKKKSKRSK
jgi:hypothetical protein